MARFILPWPPSVNTYYTVARGRKILSKKGREFKAAAVAEARRQRGSAKPLTGWLTVTMFASPPTVTRKRDGDNYIKATLDALTDAGVWDDDSQARDTRIVMLDKVKGGSMLVEVKPFDAEAWGCRP